MTGRGRRLELLQLLHVFLRLDQVFVHVVLLVHLILNRALGRLGHFFARRGHLHGLLLAILGCSVSGGDVARRVTQSGTLSHVQLLLRGHF